MTKSKKVFFRDAAKALASLEGVINNLTYHSLEGELQGILNREQKLQACDRRIHEVVENNRVAKLLKTMPGVEDLIACALAVALTDPDVFKSGRDSPLF